MTTPAAKKDAPAPSQAITPATPAASSDDAEIEKIMSEINALQEEMSAVETKKLKAVPKPAPAETVEEPEALVQEDELSAAAEEEDILKDLQNDAGDNAPMEETLSELKEDGPAKKTLLDETPEAIEDEEMESGGEVVEMTRHTSKETSDGTLKMTLTGSMTLKLQYECDGREVVVGFSDQTLRVQLADGTEFKLPLGRGKNNRDAA